MTTEIWKDIPGFEGAYQASSLGHIRSLDRRVWRKLPGKKGHYLYNPGCLLALHDDGHGYLTVSIGPRNKSMKVHCLVAIAFLGPRPVKADVRHLNGNRKDNRTENLAYGTRTLNNHEIYLTGHKTHVFSMTEVIQLRQRLDAGERICDLAQEFNVSRNAIWRIKTRRSFSWLPE